MSRPPVAIERLDLTAQGQVRYRLKTPYRDGTTHIVLEPLDFIARLAALVPPRVHLRVVARTQHVEAIRRVLKQIYVIHAGEQRFPLAKRVDAVPARELLSL